METSQIIIGIITVALMSIALIIGVRTSISIWKDCNMPKFQSFTLNYYTTKYPSLLNQDTVVATSLEDAKDRITAKFNVIYKGHLTIDRDSFELVLSRPFRGIEFD